MSIYATLWQMRFPADGWTAIDDTDFVEVWAQAVLPHIGHPAEYPDGDPYADFLPPIVGRDFPEPPDEPYRAVFICGPHTTKGTARSHQEYVNPLVSLTGTEYAEIRWVDLWERIGAALRAQLGMPRTTAIYLAPNGSTTRFTDDREE